MDRKIFGDEVMFGRNGKINKGQTPLHNMDSDGRYAGLGEGLGELDTGEFDTTSDGSKKTPRYQRPSTSPKRGVSGKLEYYPGSDNSNGYLGRFREELARATRETEEIDPYSTDPLSDINRRLDTFLLRHAGKTFREFVSGVDYSKINGDDYGSLGKRGIKMKLFEHRSTLYLLALEACERRGIDIKGLLEEAQSAQFPNLKRDEKEPTLEEIKEALIE